MSKFLIKTLTPVHVGSGRFLQNKLEYVFGGDKIGIVDETKSFELIGIDRIGAWVSSIEKGESLVGFLKNFGIKPKLSEITSRSLRLQVSKEEAKNLQNLKEHIHNGMGLPYIPGSSIKGAIRSAVFNQLIRESKKLLDSKIIDKGKPSAKQLEKELFGGDPNSDIFRFLRVGDAYFESGTEIALIFTSLNQRGNPDHPSLIIDRQKNQLVEAIGSNAQTDFQMRFDLAGMKANDVTGKIKNFPGVWSDLTGLIALLKKNTSEILGEEIESWETFEADEAADYREELGKIRQEIEQCTETECVLRLAHGAGWQFITGNWAKKQQLVGNQVYETILNAARPGNERRYADYAFPKSRRMATDFLLPGFVKLCLVVD